MLRVVCFTAAAPVVFAGAASTSSAAVTLGPNPLPQRSSVISSAGARIFANGVVPGATVVSPIAGIVTHWRVRRGSGPGVPDADTITLRILHPTGAPNEFTAQGTSTAESVPGGSNDPIDVYEFPTNLPVQAGDRVGYGTNIGEFTALSQTGASYLTRTNALADGQTAAFTPGAFPDRAVLFNADVEPDANCDGLGDETQESVVSSGCLPPKAASLSRAKAQAKGGTVSVSVACSLPGGDCTGNQISLTAKVVAAAKKLMLGSASFSIPAGQSQIVPVALSKRARKLIRQRGKVTAIATITGGSSPNVGKLKIKAKK